MEVSAGQPVEVGGTLLVASYDQACFQGQAPVSGLLIDPFKGPSPIMARPWSNGCEIVNLVTEAE